MEKVLFIDRDGTIIWEPPVTYQIDSFEKLKFLPGSIYWLTKIAKELDFTLVMVTNQDGLGTDSFPEKDFWPVQNFIIDTLKNEGVVFKDIFIDKSFPEQNLPTRKPGTAMLTAYMNGNYDLANSFVIGDRATDVELAKNLGSKSVFIQTEETKNADATYSVNTWEEIYTLLKLKERTIVYSRNTNETKINVELNLDGKGKAEISTGLPFFDHMLEQIARHSSVDMKLTCKGDLHIDEHHTIEDTAITLGEAFLQALGDKRGIERYAFCLPMDDCLAQVALDFGGRNWIEWNAEFKREKIGDMPTEMFYHFFKSFSDAAKCNLNIKAEGTNEHHKIEAIFKGLAKCMKQAVKRDINNNELPSTKGTL
jgi:imidazoleglycerol-phosphate dehydratase/histidinol-phosphatase